MGLQLCVCNSILHIYRLLPVYLHIQIQVSHNLDTLVCVSNVFSSGIFSFSHTSFTRGPTIVCSLLDGTRDEYWFSNAILSGVVNGSSGLYGHVFAGLPVSTDDFNSD